jgi:hypothetical protein
MPKSEFTGNGATSNAVPTMPYTAFQCAIIDASVIDALPKRSYCRVDPSLAAQIDGVIANSIERWHLEGVRELLIKVLYVLRPLPTDAFAGKVTDCEIAGT